MSVPPSPWDPQSYRGRGSAQVTKHSEQPLLAGQGKIYWRLIVSDFNMFDVTTYKCMCSTDFTLIVSLLCVIYYIYFTIAGGAFRFI